MTSASENAEIRVLRDKIGSAENKLSSLSVKAERISEIIASLDNLETRVRALEENKNQLKDLIAYKGTSDGRITSLEQTNWYYKGGMKAIVAIILSSGVLGAILAIAISKGWFHS